MTRQSFAQDLEVAAARIGELDRAEIATLLRRAALRLRNVDGAMSQVREGLVEALDSLSGIEAKVDDGVTAALKAAAKDMNAAPNDALAAIVRDWLVGHGYLEHTS